MERHRPSAARTRDRSLRPPRGAATALATVLTLLLLPGTAAGASGSSPAPAPPPVDSALSAALAMQGQSAVSYGDWARYFPATMMVAFLTLYIVPKMSDLFKSLSANRTLPTVTLVVLWFSNGIVNNILWLLPLALIIGLVIGNRR